MELISTDEFFIFQNIQKGETNLWCCRQTGRFQIRPSWDLAGQENPECLGLVWGIYGKISIHPDLPERLVLVRHCDRVGEIPGKESAELNKHSVYKVTNVVLVPILPPEGPASTLAHQLQLKPCPKHNAGAMNQPEFEPTTSQDKTSNPFGKIAKIGGSLKTLATDNIKSTAGNLAVLESQVKVPWKSPRLVSKTLERYEKRILEELNRLFNDSNSFYFCITGDITNSLQRQVQMQPHSGEYWLSNIDDRFFFNKELVKEIIDMEDTRAHHWVTPFIQGFVEIKDCSLNMEEADAFYGESENQGILTQETARESQLPSFYTVALISRRSRHRAGTRYKRRGVDEEGHVANYVETEQILIYHHYALSFLQVRGSVPIHWSQPGYKYRPPPRLDKTPDEDQQSFMRHFSTEFAVYGPPIHCINLAERYGRERVISEAYLDQALWYNNPDLTFISFDFHDACRGMHFENVAILTDSIDDILKSMRYTWLDKHGLVCSQNGVFRVNCIDCLDRTNVVQTAIARQVLEIQLSKLGVSPPEQPLPDETRRVFQVLWANNGDALSRQYAGTNALKGDFTRTGERNLSGLMKDGMNSASRYYLNQFRDAYRQATIDLITGQIVGESLMATNMDEIAGEGQGEEEEFDANKAEQVKAVIEDCQKLLIPDLSSIIGTWGLIDSDPVSGDLSQEDMDVILILTRDSYYIANYDDDVDKVTRYQRVAFFDIESIEFGPLEESAFQLSFRKTLSKNEHHLRISYKMPGQPVVSYNDNSGSAIMSQGSMMSGYFHMFRSTNLRFFNNITLAVKTEEERYESLRSVADSLAMAVEMAGIYVDYTNGKLPKRRSRIPDAHSNFNEISGGRGVRTNLAVQALRGSSKAFSNVTSQISRLNPLAKLKQSNNQQDVPSINLEAPQQADNCDPSQNMLSTNHAQPYDANDYEVQQYSHDEPGRTTPTIILDQGLQNSARSRPGRKLANIPMLKPIVNQGKELRASTSKLLHPESLSPALSKRFRKLSKSSEDLSFESETSVPPHLLNFHSRDKGGGSLQKDLNVATQALEDVAIESANVAKEVLNPFAKLTKGIQNVVLKKKGLENECVVAEGRTAADIISVESSATLPRSASSDYMAGKVAEASSHTKVILL